MTPIKLHYTESLIRKAVRAFWWRRTGWRFIITILMLFGLFAGLLWNGDRSWVVGVLGAVLALAVTFSVALYAIHYRGSVGRLRRMRTPEATLELGEESFRVSSEAGTSEMAWSAVTDIWSFPEFFLIFFSQAQFITIPTTDIDTGVCEFIISKAKLHKVDVPTSTIF